MSRVPQLLCMWKRLHAFGVKLIVFPHIVHKSLHSA